MAIDPGTAISLVSALGSLFGRKKLKVSPEVSPKVSPAEEEYAAYLRELRQREAQREATLAPLLQALVPQLQAGITAPTGLSADEILRMYAAQREQAGREAELLGRQISEAFAGRFPGALPSGLEARVRGQLGRALLETLASGQREILLESERLRREQQARAMQLAAALAGSPTVIPQVGAGLGGLAELGAERARTEALLGAERAQTEALLGAYQLQQLTPLVQALFTAAKSRSKPAGTSTGLGFTTPIAWA